MRAKEMKLNVVEYDANELVERFISSKREPTKTYLSEIKNDISQADFQYRDCGDKNSLKTITPIALKRNHANALKKCYYDKTKEIKLIIKEVRDEQNVFHERYCPFCGFRQPVEIDHYLPMAEFAEFSFIPVNLIPICSVCNKTKNKSWIDDGERLFLNKYFDDDNLDEFLICKPKILDENSILFEYYLDIEKLEEMPIGNIIKTHYEKLNITSIYENSANIIISDLDDSLLLFKGNFQNLKEMIEKHYENCREKYGVNFYKTVTYKSIFQTNDVLRWYYARISDEKKY